MPVVNCPIDIPEGWEFVRYGVPTPGEPFLNENGDPDSSDVGCVAPWVIIRPARPALQVGDWVKVDCEGSTLHGRTGKVSTGTSMDGSLMVRFSGGVARWIKPEDLRKQTRTIEPYTMDQFMVEASKRGRHVQCGSKSTIIESIHIAGVTLSCPSIGFVSYIDATSQLTWSGGEAFGAEKWEDAE